HGALAGAGEGVDAGVRADPGGGVDGGLRVDAVRRRLGAAVQVADDGHEGRQGILDQDGGQAVGLEGSGDDGGGGGAAVQLRGVFVVLDEGDVAGSGLAEGAGAVD